MSASDDRSSLTPLIESVSPHDHLCLIYETRAEQFAAVMPFLRLGLARGEQCVDIADENTAAGVLAALGAEGVDVEGALASGALSVLSKRDACVRDGRFDPDRMIAFLEEAAEAAAAAGFAALRVTGEMTWALGDDPGAERLVEYEARVNRFFAQHRASAICQYHKSGFGPRVLADVLRAHPRVVAGGLVCRNVHYVPPEELLRPDRSLLEAERLLGSILERERAERALVRALSTAERLADLGRLISQSLDPSELVPRIVAGVRRLLSADGAALYRLEPETDDLLVLAVSEGCGGTVGAGGVLPRGTGLGAVAVREGRGVSTPNILVDPRVTLPASVASHVEGLPHRAALAVPLQAQGRILGVLSVADRLGRLFGSEEIGLAQAFADHAAIALENARLYAAATREHQQATELSGVMRALTESLELAEVAQRIVDSVLPLLHGRSAALRLLESDNSLRGIAWAGLARGHFEPGHTMVVGMGVAGRAALEGRPAWSPDVMSDPTVVLSEDQRARNAAAGTRAILAVPLRLDGQVIGVLSVGDVKRRMFSDEEVTLLQTFAAQAAVAVRNARHHEEATRRRREAELLAELARTITGSLDLGAVLQRVADAIRELCGSDLAAIALRDPPSGHIVFRYWSGARFAGVGFAIEPGKGLGGQVLLTGRPFRTDHYAADPRITKDYLPYVEAEGVVADLAVPIWIDERIDGLLYAQSRTARPFTDRDEAVLGRLAGHAAVAIRNASLYTETWQQLRHTEVLLAVGQAVAGTLDVTGTMRRVARELSRVLGADMVGAYVPDGDGSVLRPLAGYHVPADLLQAFREVPFPLRGHAFLEEGCRRGEAVFCGHPEADPRIDHRLLERFPSGAILFVPLMVKGELVGGLFAVWWRRRESPPPEDTRLAEGIARQAALALANARLYDEAERRRRAAEGLAEVGRLLSQSLDPALVWKAIVESLRALVGGHSSSLHRLDEESGALVALAFSGEIGEFVAPGTVQPKGVGVAAVAIRERRPVAMPDFLADPRVVLAPAQRAALQARRFRSALVVPLLVGERVIGALGVAVETGRTIPADDVELVGAFAAQAAVALENSRLYAESRCHAEALRESEERFRAAFDGSLIGRALEAFDGRYLRVNRALCEILGHSEEELLATTWQALTHPDDVAPGLELDAKLGAGETTAYQREKRFVLREGRIVWATISVALLRDAAGRPVCFLSEIQDITARKQAGEALRQHAERLRVLHEIDQAIVAARSPETIAEAALRRIRQLVPCQRAGVVLLDLEAQQWAILAVETARETRLPTGSRLPLDSPSDIADLSAGRVRVVPDTQSPSARSVVTELLAREGIRSYVLVPLMSQGALIGWLSLCWETPARFTLVDIEIAREVADSLAVVIRNAQLFAQVSAARADLQAVSRRLVEVQEQERRHVARELHDEIGQVLTGLKFAVEMGIRDPAAAGRTLEQARTLANELITRVRALSLDLRPAMLDDLGLLPALLWQFERYRAQTGIRVQFEHLGIEGRFRSGVETAAYRITQEGLTNVARHTRVREVTVRVWADARALGVQVEDRGGGFDPEAVSPSGGVKGMRERADLLGGRLVVESAAGVGTRVTAELPLDGALDRRQSAR